MGKYKRTMLMSVVLAILAVGFGLVIWPKLPKPKLREYIGIVGRYTLQQVPSEIEQELGVGLVTIGPDQKPQPGLASRWEITPDGKQYRFYLRQDAVWSNGEKVKLEDLSINIPDVAANRIEPNILEFTLPEAFSPFPSVVSRPLIKGGRWTLGEYQIGDLQTVGQFLKQVSLESERKILVYRFYSSVSQAVTAFKLGEIDRLTGFVEQIEILDWPNVEIITRSRTDFYVAVFYNNQDPIFRENKSLRQALSYAIADKKQGQTRALGPINLESWAYTASVKDYEYDLNRAKELYRASLPADVDEISLELATTPDLLSLAEEIKANWEKLGVMTEIKVVASKPSEYQAWLTIQPIPSDPDQYIYWHSTQVGNFTNLRNPRVDKLMEDGRQMLDQEKRRQIYFDFQRFLAEEAPATFLYHPTEYIIKRR